MGATGQQKQRNSGKDRGKDTVNNSANNNATGGDLGSRDVRTAVHGDIQALEQRLEGLRQRAARLDEPGSVSAYVAELDACLSTLRVAEEELLAWEAQQEMALATAQQERQRYQDLFDWAPGAHLVTDAAGLIQEANQAAADLLGLSPRALRGKPLAAFLIDDTDDEQDDGKQQHEQQDGGKDGHQTLRRLLLEAAFGASVRGQIHEVQACLKPHKAALLRVRVRVSSSAGSLRWLLHEVVPQQQQHGGAANDVVLRADLARQRHIAATLQSALLPPLRDSAFAGLSVVTRYAAAAESEARVGGDFYDAFLLPDGRVALVVGDVSGKGLAAATRGAEARHALRAYLRADPKHPAQALARLNEYLCLARDLDEPDSNGSAGFLVLSLAVVDPSSGVTQVACAGAEPPFVLLRQSHARVTEHRSHSGTTADTPDASAAGTITGPVDVLPSGGLLLGLQAAETYPVHTLVLHPGDVLVMVTDGLTEARAASGSTGSATLLGYDGLVRLAATAAGTAKEEQEEEELLPMLADSILNGARAFAQGVLHDDACLLLAARSSTDSSTEEDNAEPPRQQTTQAAAEAAQEQERHDRRLLRRITQIQEQERLRLARELHDEMGQQLTVLLLGLKRLEEASHGRAATLQLVHEVRQVADTLGQQVHHLATELRPIALTDVGLVPALESYVEEWSARTGIAAEMACVGLDRERRLAPEVETTIYRVVQEAFTNVARHAAATATRVSLVLRRDNTHLVAIVEDDGPGFDPDEAAHGGRLGLVGMQERAALVNGTLEIESSPGQGTTVYLRLPSSSAAAAVLSVSATHDPDEPNEPNGPRG